MRLTTFSSRLRLAGLILVTLLALVGLGLRAAGAGETDGVAYRGGNLIRLHILANSDSPADQRVKLQVRDDLLREAGKLFQGVEEAGRAREIIRRNLPFFRQTAERRLRQEGFAYPVTVHYGVYPFPVRTYGRLTLPAGRYTALRVVLGEGRGHNWWCVLFPPLCFLEIDAQLARDRVKPAKGTEGQHRVAIRVRLPRPPGQTSPVPLSVLASPVWP
ncbi:MAG: stage II sporulation protein R [Bacillota bacterium]|nr:stage II sporulation protein R [Bacillota bacterium]